MDFAGQDPIASFSLTGTTAFDATGRF